MTRLNSGKNRPHKKVFLIPEFTLNMTRKKDECKSSSFFNVRAQGDKLCLVSQKYFLDLEKHPSPKLIRD